LLFKKEYTLHNAYLLEQKILKENAQHRIQKEWSTELFDLDISNNIIKYFNED
jgi:hypothetical protein